MFNTILIANRGEIAVRIAQTARRLGIRTVAIYSDADRDALHVAVADDAFRIGPAPVSESYLRADAILEAARKAGAEAIHPGYGFLSENPEFVEATEAAGLTFIGPPAAAIRAMGLKDAAKALMEKSGVPIVPGYNSRSQHPERLAAEAERIGYPVLIKAAAGGGGKGMRRVEEPGAFSEALAGATREARSAFGDDRVLIERYLARSRHIEVQVFADRHGNAIHLFERDCSLQRRYQKVVEEAPAPGMSAAMRDAMGAAAVKAAQAVGYEGAGTVEFIADVSDGLRDGRFYFMEMNTRLQVEHPVTEMITGLDLVEWQFRVAAGEPLPKHQDELTITGHAVEARLYAEDPSKGFLPQTGRLSRLAFAAGAGIRVDAGVRQGDVITPFYDPMIAKVIAHAPTRYAALDLLGHALRTSRAEGCTTNMRFLARLIERPDFARGGFDTGLIDRELGSLVEEPQPPSTVVAVAALEAAGFLGRPADAHPFSALSNFRLWGEAQKEVRVVSRGETRKFSTAALPGGLFRVGLDPDAVTLRILERDGDAIRISSDDRISRFRVARGGDVITVASDADEYRFTVPGADADVAEEGEAGGVVRATMPGVVRVLHVAPGQAVSKGDPLVVTEAMKMELTLFASQGGRVACVNVAAGDQVQEGDVLVTIETSDDPS